jgi:hypothetical protein
MSTTARLAVTLLPGAREMLSLHARELPQRDDLCGAFCASLALRAAGVSNHGSGPVDQDAVALAAGTVISATPAPEILPAGERGRRDYRLALPTIDDEGASGTTAEGLVRAIGELSDGRVEAVPLAGPWTEATLAALFDLAAELQRPATLLANLATHHLWGSRATLPQLLGYLIDGDEHGPAPDWDVGHFALVFGRVAGEAGTLYALADTYRSLGQDGVHMQPAARLAAAIDRRDKPAGGVIVAVCAADAAAVRERASAAGLREGLWDNGTPPAAMASAT